MSESLYQPGDGVWFVREDRREGEESRRPRVVHGIVREIGESCAIIDCDRERVFTMERLHANREMAEADRKRRVRYSLISDIEEHEEKLAELRKQLAELETP